MRTLKTPEEIMGEDPKDVHSHTYSSDDVHNMIIAAQRDALECDSWISINDNLPERSNPINNEGKLSFDRKLNKVQVYSPSTIGVDTGHYWGTDIDGPMKGWSIMGVTHWKPLSQPPNSKPTS